MTEHTADYDARLANLCCGHLACQREVRRLMERAWDEGRAAERRDWEFTFDLATPDEDRQSLPNPYHVIPPERRQP